jgi:DNA-binding NtrC family response regulator
VRELQNCIERMVAMNSGPVLHTADLPTSLQSRLLAEKAEALAAPSTAPAPQPSPVITLEQTEKQAILHALEFTHGDQTQAARLLGIGRTTLYRKLKRYKP